MRPYVIVLEPQRLSNDRALGPEYIATRIRPMRLWEHVGYILSRSWDRKDQVTESDQPSLGIETTAAVYSVLQGELGIKHDTGSVGFIAPAQNIAGPLEDLVI